jgi:Lrp/AsnC family leucine-responsive transcriptional regulator
MEEIDLKDKKILMQLTKNSRQSLTQIAKKVGLTKDFVFYRIKRLENTGIIKKYLTQIDVLKIGIIGCRFYYKFQYTTPQLRNEIIEYFISHPLSIVVYSLEGSFDLEVRFLIPSSSNFFSFYETTSKKYRDYFSEQVFTVNYFSHIYGYSFLMNEKEKLKSKVFFKEATSRHFSSDIKVDKLDFQILSILNINARIPIVDIAKLCNSTSRTILQRMKRLEEIGIIGGYSIDLDYSKLGYRFYVVSFELKKYAELHNIIEYVSKNPALYLAERIVGFGDLTLGFILKNVDELHVILDDLSKKFPDVIRKYNYYSHLKEHKCQFLCQL